MVLSVLPQVAPSVTTRPTSQPIPSPQRQGARRGPLLSEPGRQEAAITTTREFIHRAHALAPHPALEPAGKAVVRVRRRPSRCPMPRLAAESPRVTIPGAFLFGDQFAPERAHHGLRSFIVAPRQTRPAAYVCGAGVFLSLWACGARVWGTGNEPKLKRPLSQRRGLQWRYRLNSP
jgi:hypothetical protein